jgi:hypothetical protein
LVVEGRPQIRQRILNGRRLGGRRPTESTAATRAAGTTTAAWAAATTAEHAASAAGVGVALELHDRLNFRLNGREFIIAGAELLLIEIHHGLRVAAATKAASPTTVLAAIVLPAIILATVILATVILVLAKHWHSQEADHERRHKKPQAF